MEASKLYELGTALKKRREALGMTREDLALRIKISSKNLHAIEEGLTDNLPQPIFTRSFIRSYAQVVSLDTEELDRMLAEVFPSEVMDNIKPGLTTAAREQSVGINTQGGSKKFILLILLALILLGVGTWFYFNVFKTNFWTSSQPATTQTAPEQNSEAPAATEANPAQVAPVASSDAPDTPVAEGATADSETAGSAEAGNPQSTGAATTGERYAVSSTDSPNGQNGTDSANGREAAAATAEQQAAAPAPANPVAPGVADAPANTANTPATAERQRITAGNTVTQSNASAAQQPAPGNQRLLVSGVSGECWINVKFDDVGERNLRLMPGRHFVLDFKSRATLVLGNAAAVKVSYNGQPLNYNADPGDVRVFRFPR
ncbi:MAG: DUF4115 domain-containing protein [Deltaproteobacteria bacterium]|jgi:cytoskeleton protein RodZ|nr:DUF4115 domain-containing protein [Deltaproteobacteria bacterium]